jgi:para-nitrobenzyl esterase
LDPCAAYASGIAKDITFLQGCNKDEMNCFVSMWTVEGFKAWAAERKTHKYAQLLSPEERAKIDSYCNEGAVEDWDADSRLFSHSWFIDGAIKMSESQTMGGGKSYTYYFRVESSDPILKSAHFEEVPIVFAHPEFVSGRPYDPSFCKAMRKLWVQFAKTGVPADNWPLYDLKDKQVMVLDEDNIHPAKESEVNIVDWDRTYFLTKYYML